MKTTKQNPLKTSRTYPTDSFDRLSNLLPGPRTEELIEKTSENIVKCGIRVYRIIREIEASLTPITEPGLKKASFDLSISKGRLEKVLSNDPEFSRRIAFGRLCRPNNRPPDNASYLLIIYLREHLKALLFRPHNALICDFLLEQKINDKINPARISKVAKIPHKKLKEIYEFFGNVYDAPGLSSDSLDSFLRFLHETNRVAVDEPSELRDLSLFPSWDEFMPQLHNDNSPSL